MMWSALAATGPGRSALARDESHRMTTTTPWPYPFWIAHRGAGKLAPENTLAAFKLGASHGYRMFECDVKLSSDGVPFLLHDDQLDRTTDGRDIASLQTWQALSTLDAGSWRGREFAHEPIPSLDAVATFCIGNACALNIEIKPTTGNDHETGRVVATHAARLWQGSALPPLLSSFKPLALRAAKAAAPDLRRALLLDRLREGWYADAQDIGCVAVVTNHQWMDERVVEQLHGAGMRALVYTVNDASDVERMKSADVDGIITDAVDRFGPT